MAFFGASQNKVEKVKKLAARIGLNDGVYAIFYQLGYVGYLDEDTVERLIPLLGMNDRGLEENLVPLLAEAYADGRKDAEEEMPSRVKLKLSLLVGKEPEPEQPKKSGKEELEEKRRTVKEELLRRIEPCGFMEYQLPYGGNSNSEGHLNSVPVQAAAHKLIATAEIVAKELGVKIACSFCCYTNIKTTCLIFYFLDTKLAVGPKVPD